MITQNPPVAIVRWFGGNQSELTMEGRVTTNGPMLPLMMPPVNSDHSDGVGVSDDDVVIVMNTCVSQNLEDEASIRRVEEEPLQTPDPSS